MLCVDQPTPAVGQAAAGVAVWPRRIWSERLINALDFAAVAVSDFGETGYDDAVRPALGFGPEKVVAEATMLAYAAHGASESRAVGDRVDALARQLDPLVRSRRALADMALNPDQVFRRAVPHVLLTAIGYPDDAFDEFAADECARVLSHAVDQPATVLAERRWITSVWDRPLPTVSGRRVSAPPSRTRSTCSSAPGRIPTGSPTSCSMSPTSAARPPPSSAGPAPRSWPTSKPWSSGTSTTATTTSWANC